MKRYAAVVFDLDGTLLDTAADLQAAVNHAMSVLHCPPRTVEEVRRFAGNGIRKLVERSLPADRRDGETVGRAPEIFCAYYAAHNADRTVPYAGVPALLQALRGHGLRLAVVSNKADFAVQALCERFFPAVFAAVIGAREGMPKKPAPAGVLQALRELGTGPADALYVGDSDVDGETAKNAGMDCVLVSWGFRERPLLESMRPLAVADDAAALQKIILNGEER